MKELEYLIDKAKAAGAEQADIMHLERNCVDLTYRQGKMENLARSENSEVGLRVMIGKRQAVTSTSDFSKESLDKLVERVTDMVRVVPEDPNIGLADASQFIKDPATQIGEVEGEVATAELEARVKEAEDAMLSVKGVAQSEGASSSWNSMNVRVISSEGFSGLLQTSQQVLSCVALAGSGENMQRDYDYSAVRSAKDLRSPTDIGKQAGEKAVNRLNPKKIKTGTHPIVYDRRVAGHYLLQPFVSAINGETIARGTSFLMDAMDQPVFSKDVTILDDPTLVSGLGSRTFDREGIPAVKREFVEQGTLKSWMLNLHAARQLGLESTGHAVGVVSAPPMVGCSNFFIAPGERSPEKLLQDVGAGFYVTELMGFGINGVTGDYSLGASGFWIENGKLAYPVSEVTIAGNLKEMYRTLVPANDLVFDSNICAPTVLIESMMVAGL